jgi:hypothetical protein
MSVSLETVVAANIVALRKPLALIPMASRSLHTRSVVAAQTAIRRHHRPLRSLLRILPEHYRGFIFGSPISRASAGG